MAGKILGVIRAPAPGMREVARSGALPGFAAVVLWVVVSLLAAGLGLLLGGFASVDELLEGLPPGSVPQEVDEASLESIVFGAQAVGIGLRALWPLLYWAVLTLVMYLVTKLFGGAGSLSGMFGAMGVACVPFVISGLLQLIVTGGQAASVSTGVPEALGIALGAVGALVSVAALIWHVALVVIGASAARSLSYGGSAGSCATSCAAVIGIPLLLLLLLGGVLTLLGGGG